LAAAVEKLGDCDLLLCGLSALDGETGQVGPQIAERLGLPQATGCEALAVADGRLVVRRIVEGGYESLTLPFPALVTVTETGFTPRYLTFPLRRRAAAAQIRRLGADQLGLPADRAGLEASPTKVAHMESVPLPSVDTRYVGPDLSYDDLVAVLRRDGALNEVAPIPSTQLEGDPGVAEIEADPRAPAVLVVCEIGNGALTGVSAEILSKARALAEHLEGSVAAFVAGSGLDAAVEDAVTFGADIVLVADDQRLSRYTTLPYARVLSDALIKYRPDAVLLGATSTGRDLAPRVAARLNTGLAADCTDLHIADWTRRDRTYERLLHQVRPAMGSSVLATCICPEARPQMATVRAGVFPSSPAPRAARIESIAVDLRPEDFVVEAGERNVRHSDVRLSDARIVVAGGAGCSADNWYLVEDLAAALGGRVAASRAAVEAGRAERALQVGQTGTTIQPALYVACGISGAFQHAIGMKAAETVVAINRDPDATIFRFAHYGIVADVAEALPQLTTALVAQ
jgi:electron transfer flavoprotein alpha subunit